MQLLAQSLSANFICTSKPIVIDREIQFISDSFIKIVRGMWDKSGNETVQCKYK